jgi:hypothetical protein
MNVDNTIITIAEIHDHPSTSHVKPSAPPSSPPMLQKNSFTENELKEWCYKIYKSI